MPVYAYKGVTKGNRNVRGVVEGDSLRAARSKLRADGIFPTKLNPSQASSSLSDLSARFKLPDLRRVPDLQLSLFTSQLATLIEAGVPLVESLGALTEQIDNPRLKSITGKLREGVNEGLTLSDAMGNHPQVFDDLFRAMVHAGESSGSLGLVLRRLSTYVESRMELRNKVISAMTYPVLMLVVSFGVLGFLLVFVIPNITQLLADMGQELPTPTKVVLAVSDFLTQWWSVLLIATASAFLLFNRVIHTERGRLAWDRFRLQLPVAGKSVRQLAISRFARTLSTLVSGGVEIVRALEISRGVAANAVIGEAIEAAGEAITRGASIALPLRQSGEFPPLVTHMISVGEASGELDAMLNKISDTYDELVDHSLSRLTAVMGPIMLLVVASIVVLVILSTLLPLLNLTASL